MADFVAVIRRAVDGLSENTPATRQRVYDKARVAVRRQLEGMSPRPSDVLVRRQLDKLDAAIEEVELEHVEALPPLEDDDVHAEAEAGEALPADAEPEEDEHPIVAPARPREMPREANRPDAAAAAHEAVPARERNAPEAEAAAWGIAGQAPAANADYAWRAGRESLRAGDRIEPSSLTPTEGEPFEPAPFADSALIGEAHDAAFGLNTGQPRRSSFKIGRIAAAVAVVVIVCGAAYGLWANSTAFKAMVARVAPSSDTSKPAVATTEPAKTTPAAADKAASASAKPQGTNEGDEAPAKPAGGKFTQRLLADGSESDPGPAPQTDQGAPAEGKSVAAQSEADKQAAAAQGTDGTAPQGAAGSAPAQAAGEQAAVSEKMYLYEERFNDKAPAATTGTIVWSVAKESPGGDAPSEAAIHGEISIPDKGMTALVTIKRNADQSLPASHLIEIVFALPGNFDGGGIDSVDRVSMKQTEQAPGDPLIAVPAKITDNFFMIALNDYPKAVQTNLDLLKSRDWIDIPITYKNGRRALLTLEKGASGAKAFDEVMSAWASAPAVRSSATSGPADGSGATGATPGSPPPATAPGQ